ncbi:hypothetical protein ACFW04_008021 [Cataglyphis niger]
MVFGLIRWLISFSIFLIVLIIITWSVMHLGKKNHNSTDIIPRFFHVDNHSIQRENSTSRVIESTDGPALFADDQGSEVPDSAEFYNFIVKTFLSKNNGLTNSTEDDTATTIFTLSVINNETAWSEDDAIMTFTPFIINNNTTWNKHAAITIFTPSVISNDTAWRKEDTTIAIYNTSDKLFSLLNNHQNISEKS